MTDNTRELARPAVAGRLLVIRIGVVAGFALLLAGLVLGLVHVGNPSCGSTFAAGDGDNPFLPWGEACHQARQARLVPAIMLMVFGSVALLAAVAAAIPAARPRE